jgi:hypothetical protein
VILAQHDAHLIPWLKARFGLTVVQNDNYGFDAWMGDYDLDDYAVFDEKTVMAAAIEFASGYDGPLFDVLTVEIEGGENL